MNTDLLKGKYVLEDILDVQCPMHAWGATSRAANHDRIVRLGRSPYDGTAPVPSWVCADTQTVRWTDGKHPKMAVKPRLSTVLYGSRRPQSKPYFMNCTVIWNLIHIIADFIFTNTQWPSILRPEITFSSCNQLSFKDQPTFWCIDKAWFLIFISPG